MKIDVTFNGIRKDGYIDMKVAIERSHRCSDIARFEFLAVLKSLNDADNRAFMDALEAFFKSELEQDDGEE